MAIPERARLERHELFRIVGPGERLVVDGEEALLVDLVGGMGVREIPAVHEYFPTRQLHPADVDARRGQATGYRIGRVAAVSGVGAKVEPRLAHVAHVLER